MMKQIERQLVNSTYIKIIVLFIFSAKIAFSQEIRNLEGVFALDFCSKQEFNQCSNFSPVKETKPPELFIFNPFIKKISDDIVYRLPNLELSKEINIDDYIKITDFLFEPKMSTDTLKIAVNKKLKRKIRKHVRKQKRLVQKVNYSKIKYSFDGFIKYLLYRIKFECVYEGKGKTYIIDEKGSDLVQEKEVEIYYITKIIDLKPFGKE
ncbi:MAG: hypothetical protein AAFX55_20430 [Bacteroidota bacterium]